MIPKPLMVAHSGLELQLGSNALLLTHAPGTQVVHRQSYMQAKHAHTLKKKKN